MAVTTPTPTPTPAPAPSLPPPQHLTPSHPSSSHLLTSISAVHASCIQEDFTIASFLPPLSPAKLEAYWEQRAQEAARGERVIIYIPASEDGDVMGVVMLKRDLTETGDFRGWVEKLLVDPRFRKRGVARVLLREVERVARERGTGLLMLDTEKGSPAELVYPKLGYIECGFIPRYEISPQDGSLKDAVFFYKDLRK